VLTSLFLAAALALAPAPPESVTLDADRTVVTYGDPVRLSAVVEPPDERVSIIGLPYDGGSYPTQPVPGEAGRWSVEDRPLITTQYRARSGDVDSAEALGRGGAAARAPRGDQRAPRALLHAPSRSARTVAGRPGSSAGRVADGVRSRAFRSAGGRPYGSPLRCRQAGRASAWSSTRSPGMRPVSAAWR
jgi:hypothetical protein